MIIDIINNIDWANLEKEHPAIYLLIMISIGILYIYLRYSYAKRTYPDLTKQELFRYVMRGSKIMRWTGQSDPMFSPPARQQPQNPNDSRSENTAIEVLGAMVYSGFIPGAIFVLLLARMFGADKFLIIPLILICIGVLGVWIFLVINRGIRHLKENDYSAPASSVVSFIVALFFLVTIITFIILAIISAMQ